MLNPESPEKKTSILAALILVALSPAVGKSEIQWCATCSGPMGRTWCRPTEAECEETLERCESAAGHGWDGCPCPTKCYQRGQLFEPGQDPRGPASEASPDPRRPVSESDAPQPPQHPAKGTSFALPNCQVGQIAVRKSFGTEAGYTCALIFSLAPANCATIPSDAVAALRSADRQALNQRCSTAFVTSASQSASDPTPETTLQPRRQPAAPPDVPYGSLFVGISILGTILGGIAGFGWFTSVAGSVFGAFLAAAEKLKGVAVIQQSVNPATGIAISGHHLETPFAAFGVAAKSLSLLTTIASQALEFKSIAAGNRGIVNKFFKCVTSVSLNAASIAASGMLMAGLLDAGMAIGVGFILASILGCVFEGAKYGAYDYMDRHLP